jgi:hypothetical protein
MTKLKRIGIIAIVVGVFIPSVLYPFVSVTNSATLKQIALGSRGVVYEPRMNELEIVFRKGTLIKDGYRKGRYDGRIAIPYQYTLAIGITVAFLGICLIALGGKKKSNNGRTP